MADIPPIDNVDVAIESPNIAINLPAGGTTFVDSIRQIFDDFAGYLRGKDEAALTSILVVLGLAFAMITIWRMV